MYSLTVFKPPRWWEEQHRWVYDNKTHRQMDFANWSTFVKFIETLSTRPLGGKKDAELVSPAVYQPGSKRRNENVLAWAGWAAVDVDNWQPTGDLRAAICQLTHGWECVCYSTASSTLEKPKFRLLFKLSRHLLPDDIKEFWFAMQTELGNLGDKQCKDFCRMYYVPATYLNAYNFFFHFTGPDVDVDSLMIKHPMPKKVVGDFLDRLPDAWKDLVLDYKVSSLTNDQHTWTSYHDCPFVDKKMINQYQGIAAIDGSGRYAMIYKMMVAIASKAVKKKYPITPDQLVDLIKQLDQDTSRKYQNRALDVEAANAIEYVYRHAL